MNEKLAILVLTNDIVLVKNLQERTKSFVAEVMFVPLSNGEKLAEYATKFSPDAVLCDDAFIDPMSAQLTAKIKQTLAVASKPNQPFFLLSCERNTADLKKIMSHGFNDVFTKPVDPSLFFQKLQLHLPTTKFLKDKLLFSMNVNSSLDLAMESKLVSASEYGVTIHLNREVGIGDLFTLHGGMFGDLSGQCLGRVMSCARNPNATGGFEASLVFVAPKKEILSTIRLWIKQQYVHAREANS